MTLNTFYIIDDKIIFVLAFSTYDFILHVAHAQHAWRIRHCDLIINVET